MQPTASWAGMVMDTNDPQRLARFWATVLGYTIIDDSPGWVELVDPDRRRPHFACQGINAHVQHGASTSKGNRFHVDLGLKNGLETDPSVLAAFGDRLEKLGARRVERIGAQNEPANWIWADPEGNVFCAPGQ